MNEQTHLQSALCFLWLNGQQAGPFDLDEMKAMWRRREIAGETLHCAEGETRWSTLKGSRFNVGAIFAAELKAAEADEERAKSSARFAAGLQARKQAEEEREQVMERAAKMPVSTGELPFRYDVIGPIYFCLTNRGIFTSQYKQLLQKHRDKIAASRAAGKLSATRSVGIADAFLFLEGDITGAGRNFEQALFVAVEEMRERAASMGADGLAWLRHDLDMDTKGLDYFYIQMSATAVTFPRE